MPRDERPAPSPSMDDILTLTAQAVPAAEAHLDAAREAVRGLVAADGLDAHQTAAHALAWTATTVEALRQMQGWVERLAGEGRLGEAERLILQIAFGEYLWQLYGGIPMGQGEIVRPQDLGMSQQDQRGLMAPAVMRLSQAGNTEGARARLAAIMGERCAADTVGDPGLDREMDMVRAQFRRFSRERVEPRAQGWHLADALIPVEVVEEMAALGVFGLTIPEEHGGAGLSKLAMCVVAEELSRGWIGVGSLATRSEIAAELILHGGTPGQRDRWLPGIASGAVLPAAVFTEPDTGSDLGALRTRAVREGEGEGWAISGAKTWITHAARANLMSLLARTTPGSTDHRGLSMFLAEKTPGTEGAPFPDPGLSGGEIGVLGYRGMREYDLALDGFRMAGDGLLGGVEGQGFKQLMRTFEGARIQTAARAVGVAQSALDLSLRHACERRQFGRPLIAFPRVAGKLATMAAEIMAARQLTYLAAARKDSGRRCDLEAGMAKLLAARVAWTCADMGVQIHGGAGFALESPISRVLCDARVLSIFEGSAEIQAQVIARRLLA